MADLLEASHVEFLDAVRHVEYVHAFNVLRSERSVVGSNGACRSSSPASPTSCWSSPRPSPSPLARNDGSRGGECAGAPRRRPPPPTSPSSQCSSLPSASSPFSSSRKDQERRKVLKS
mmetsp:Transcript_10576/g.34937  ORF Transcript_10576/g.34937 Transcript_10576/m.34937 type:complete len:118 (+) Transcript_10576:131-484(+)